VCVCLLVTFVTAEKVDERIEMQFEWVTRVDPRNHVLDGVQIHQAWRQFWRLSDPPKSTGVTAVAYAAKYQ